MSQRVLIKGGTVLSMDRSIGNLKASDVLIEDGLIQEVGASLRARNADVIDASHAIVMPGFVDTHRHTWHSLFRNAGGQAAGITPDLIRPHHSPDHVYAATLIGLLGATEAGITTVVDWADIPAETPLIEAALQAHTDAGLRTVFVAVQKDWEGGGVAAVKALADRGLPDRAFAIGSPDPPHELDAMSALWRSIREVGLRIHAHAGVDEGSRGVVARLGELELLGEDVTLAHCTNLSDQDLDVIASSDTRVSLTPAVEMTEGMGRPPLQSLIDRGIRPGLGVGTEMESPGDIFAQMRAAQSVQHATLFDLKLAGKGGVPNLLGTRDVIRFGTIDGAKAAGLSDITGSLSPGKRGDVVILRTDRPNIAPVNDPIGAVVWGMDTSNIDWVLVGGRAVVSAGELTHDVTRARDLAVQAQREVAAAAGLLASAETSTS